MSLTKLIVLAAVLLPAAFGQSWAQPVREMEKEARSAFSGSCPITGPGSRDCYFQAGGSGAMTVPAGKVLVIEDVSGYCNLPSSTDLFVVALRASAPNAGGVYRPVHYTRVAQGVTGSVRYQASNTTRIYIPAGMTLRSFTDGNFYQCEMYVQGHMVNLQ